jgi:Ca2+-transporting ATPase
VLVVNLLTDGPPAIALALDPAGAGREAPTRGTALLGGRVVAWLLAVGTAIGLLALAAYLVVRESRPEAAQTAAFATVALAELAFVYTCRSERVAAWRLPSNPYLHAAVLGSLGLVAAAVYLPFLHEPLGTVALTGPELALVAALALVPAGLSELAKAVARSGVGGGG